MAGSASAIRAGAAYAELVARDNKLVQGLKSAEARIKAFGAAISSLGTKFAALGGAVFLPLLAAAKTFTSSGSELLLMSQRTGIAVESLSQLNFAAQQAGVSAEDLETGIIRMSRSIGSGGQSLDRRLEQVADEIAAIQDPAERVQRTIEIFGRGGAALLPLLNRGAEGIRAFREEADRLGITRSAASVQQARETEIALANAGRGIKSVFTAIGGLIAPLVTAGARKILELVAVSRAWIRENRTLFTVLFAVSGAVLGLGTALILLGRAFSAISVIFSVLVGGF